MDITDLTPLERRIWRAFPHGTAVDVRPGEGEDPAVFRSADRDVRAEVVRALLLGGSSEPGEAPALRVAGARIIGILDLQHMEIRHPVRLTSCHLFTARGPLFHVS